MAWCPVCKLEYVEGVTICPDCKSVLVESLESVPNQDESETVSSGYEAEAYYGTDINQSEIEEQMAQMEMVARMRKAMEYPPYKSKDDQLKDNKSGAIVLILFGIIGTVVLVLNALGILSLPLYGFSLTLMNTVMGCLFFIFLVSGIRAAVKVKSLIPEVKKEEEDIEKVTEFIRSRKQLGDYVINKNAYEESYLDISERAVNDIANEFPDIEKGFAFYIVDRYASDILDED